MIEQNSYDEIPYPELAFQRTHPNRTAVLASVFGLAPPAPGKARILELGCASGSNLLPMAEQLPEAEFLGLDLSVKQIEAGEALRQAAGIKNVTLRQANVLDIDASLGKFDYIIAHGLFSWVPELVQKKILSVCRENLSPNGVAYVSYNVNPGWYFRKGLRDMMLYHVAGFPEPRMRIQQARALLDFLATQSNAGPYTDMLKAEAALLSKQPDNYLYHEFLEQHNNPVHFHEFVAHARTTGLSYLGDTQLSLMTSEFLKPEVAEVLGRISGRDVVRTGQYVDFLSNRAFRESLLVHGEQKIQRRLDWQPIRNFWISSELKPEDPAFDPASSEPATFVSPTTIQIRLKDPLPIMALAILMENAPQPMAFSQLLEGARARLNSKRPVGQDETELGEYLLEAYGVGVIDIIAHPWPCSASIAKRPRTSPLARLQAMAGQTVVNLRHQRHENLSADHRSLIELLDGERTVEEAIDILFQRIDLQKLPEEAKAQANNPARLRQMFTDSMHQTIAELRNMGLLL